MTQKNMILVGVVILVAVVAGWYLFSQKGLTATPPAGDTETQDQSVSGATPVKGTGTLASILSKGGNYTCTVNTTEGNAQTNLVVYVSGGKTRMELRAKTAQGVSSSLIIVRDGVNAYTWMEGMTTGSKVALGPKTPIVPQASGGGYNIDENSTVGWDCHPWLTDKTMLVAPKSVTFTAQ